MVYLDYISEGSDQNGIPRLYKGSRPEWYTWVGVKNFGFTEKQKNIEQGSRGYSGPGGV